MSEQQNGGFDESVEEERTFSRRSFLIGAKGWSAAVAALALTMGPLARTAEAGWLNRGGWVNRGGSWLNRRGGGGGWINARGGGGGSWLNRGGGWVNRGGSWVNRRGGGGWINRR